MAQHVSDSPLIDLLEVHPRVASGSCVVEGEDAKSKDEPEGRRLDVLFLDGELDSHLDIIIGGRRRFGLDDLRLESDDLSKKLVSDGWSSVMDHLCGTMTYRFGDVQCEERLQTGKIHGRFGGFSSGFSSIRMLSTRLSVLTCSA